MTASRQIELRRGSSTLSLTAAPYDVQAAKGWLSEGGTLVIRIGITTATTLAVLDRYITPLYQWLSAAEVYEANLSGDPVYVYTKTCDALSTVAEVGATWLRKRIRGGSIMVDHLTGAAAIPVAIVTLTLEVDEFWQRAAAESILEVTTGSAYISTRSDGGFTTADAAVAIYARRINWTTATGLTARFFWVYGDAKSAQVNFCRVSADMRCFWGGSSKLWAIADNAGNYYYSSAQTYTVGDVLEVVCRWTTSKMTIYVNGTKVKEQSGSFTLTAPDTYRVYESDASSGTQSILSIQVWPTALTDAEIEAMVAYGRPDPELAYTVPPANDKATNAGYPLYNFPGQAPAPLRAVLASGSTDFSQVRLALRPYRTPTMMWECESGTLGTGVASNSNTDASGGSQARFTPSGTAYATRVTVTLASNPSDVAALQGDYRIFLAGYDSAASVQVNKFKWRLVVAGVAGDYSDEFSFAAVSTRSLIDLGTVSIPPGAWPPETLAAATTAYGSAYITLEIAAKNTTGTGGGTLDLDAVYLAPAEQEGVLTGTIDVSDVSGMVGWINDPPTALTVQDARSLEFGGWLTWLGDDLMAPPVPGTAGKLWAFWYRNSVEQAFPNDTCDVQLYYAPRWR